MRSGEETGGRKERPLLVSYHVYTKQDGSISKGRVIPARAASRLEAARKVAKRLRKGEEVDQVLAYGLNAMRRYL